MYSQGKTWDKLKAEYLHQVEKALASVKCPRIGQVIEDVCSHLDRRYAELELGQRTSENFQEIIAQMGPASDYAELLAQDTTPPSRKVWRRCLLGAGLAAIIIVAAAIYLTRNDHNPGIVPRQKGHIETNTIIPKVGVGDYTLGMSKDELLKHLGKPKLIFHGQEKYTLDNLPREYFMVYDDFCFGVVDDSVERISVLSPLYKFANGLGVGDSERKIKQAFGDNFHLRETKWKDFLAYEDQGLVFEVHKDNRMIIEINVTRSDYNGG
jgi:hypothetical protein